MHPHLHGQQTTTVITEHKIYPVHLLFTSNYKLPPDVDRCNLEKHLNDEDFEMVFQVWSKYHLTRQVLVITRQYRLLLAAR